MDEDINTHFFSKSRTALDKLGWVMKTVDASFIEPVSTILIMNVIVDSHAYILTYLTENPIVSVSRTIFPYKTGLGIEGLIVAW